MTAPAVDLIIKGGQVVTATDVIDAAVAVKHGTIAAIGPERLLPPADRVSVLDRCRITHEGPAAPLRADRELRRQVLWV